MLYKYRTLDNFKYFVDIIMNQRFFAANYKDLNDPMEGQYLFSSNSPENTIEAIRGEKKNLRILSLSRKNNIPLMWSHYANGHRGVAIGVNIDINKYDLRPIRYSSEPLKIDDITCGSHSGNAKKILTQKHKVWEYEEEERVFVDGSQYVNVEVVEVIAGIKMGTQDYGFIKSLIEKVNPNIKVRRAEESDNDKYFIY